MNASEKLTKFIDYVQEKINSGEFANGQALPTIRSFMEQFNLSYGTTKRGIDYLCQSGLVEKIHGRGTFVKRVKNREAGNVNRIAVFLTGVDRWDNPGIYPTVFLGLQKTAEKRGCSLLVNYILMNDISEAKINDASANSDGVILLSEYDMKLESLGIKLPVVGVCMHSLKSSMISIVDLDPFIAAQQAVDYFKGRDCKIVEIIEAEAPAYKNRARLFCNLWQEANGKNVSMDICSMSYKNDRGYLFVTGALLQYASEAYQKKTGRLLSEDFVILGLDGKNKIDPGYHSAPAIALDWQSIGRYALEECLFRINNPGAHPKRIYVPGLLVK